MLLYGTLISISLLIVLFYGTDMCFYRCDCVTLLYNSLGLYLCLYYCTVQKCLSIGVMVYLYGRVFCVYICDGVFLRYIILCLLV